MCDRNDGPRVVGGGRVVGATAGPRRERPSNALGVGVKLARENCGTPMRLRRRVRIVSSPGQAGFGVVVGLGERPSAANAALGLVERLVEQGAALVSGTVLVRGVFEC